MVPSLIMLHLYDKIPNEGITLVKGKLKKLDKVGLAKIVIGLPLLKLYNVQMVFWVGSVILGIFGVGRFMIGDRVIGALKVSLLFISYALLMISAVFTHLSDLTIVSLSLLIAGYVGLVGVAIWWGLDMFLIIPKAKRANLNKILHLFNA